MSAVLDQARARQASAVPPAIDAAPDLEERRLEARCIAASRPLGVAILAWCQEHPKAVGIHQPLVDELRVRLATQQRLASVLLSLWCEIPDTCHVMV